MPLVGTPRCSAHEQQNADRITPFIRTGTVTKRYVFTKNRTLLYTNQNRISEIINNIKLIVNLNVYNVLLLRSAVYYYLKFRCTIKF